MPGLIHTLDLDRWNAVVPRQIHSCDAGDAAHRANMYRSLWPQGWLPKPPTPTLLTNSIHFILRSPSCMVPGYLNGRGCEKKGGWRLRDGQTLDIDAPGFRTSRLADLACRHVTGHASGAHRGLPHCTLDAFPSVRRTGAHMTGAASPNGS